MTENTADPRLVACTRCALPGDLRDASSRSQALKNNLIVPGNWHDEGDCIRHLRDVLSAHLKEEINGS